MEERLAIDASALHLAAFLSHTNSHERARSLLERALQHQPALPRAQALLGWVLVRQYQEEDEGLRDEGDLEQAMVHFNTALQQDPADLEVSSCCTSQSVDLSAVRMSLWMRFGCCTCCRALWQ